MEKQVGDTVVPSEIRLHFECIKSNQVSLMRLGVKGEGLTVCLSLRHITVCMTQRDMPEDKVFFFFFSLICDFFFKSSTETSNV